MVSIEFAKLYEHEGVVTAIFATLFVALGMIQAYLCWRYLFVRLGKRKAFRIVFWFSIVLNILVLVTANVADRFPVDYAIRDVPRWYPLFSIIVAAFVCYNSLWILALIIGRILKTWKAWRKRVADKQKLREEVKALRQKHRKKKRR